MGPRDPETLQLPFLIPEPCLNARTRGRLARFHQPGRLPLYEHPVPKPRDPGACPRAPSPCSPDRQNGGIGAVGSVVIFKRVMSDNRADWIDRIAYGAAPVKGADRYSAGRANMVPYGPRKNLPRRSPTPRRSNRCDPATTISPHALDTRCRGSCSIISENGCHNRVPLTCDFICVANTQR